jgi:dihydroflavonol-4-reductase
MHISITGGSGHIGANLCRNLISAGHSLRVLINRNRQSLNGLTLEKIPGNLLDKNSLYTLVKGSDIVIHLAATISIRGMNDRDLLSINIDGTKNLLDVIRKNPVKRFIHFSSIHALVQEPFDEVLDESRSLALNDRILYNRTKALSEKIVMEAFNDGLDGLIINPTSVIGPNDFSPSLIGRALIQICRNKLPGLVAGGYDWVDVRDIVSGTILAIEKGISGERYIFSGKWLSLPDLVKIMAEYYDIKENWIIMPYWLAELGVPFLKGYAWMRGAEPLYTAESLDIIKHSHRMISNDKARNELGYETRPLKETIRDTLEWFKNNGYL